MIGRDENLEIEIVTSRRALIDVIIGLVDHREALTVLGGHAVIEVTRDVPALPPDDTTHDGDHDRRRLGSPSGENEFRATIDRWHRRFADEVGT